MSVMEVNCSPFFGGRTCLGFKTFSIKSVAFASTSLLIEAVTVVRFFAGIAVVGCVAGYWGPYAADR